MGVKFRSTLITFSYLHIVLSIRYIYIHDIFIYISYIFISLFMSIQYTCLCIISAYHINLQPTWPSRRCWSSACKCSASTLAATPCRVFTVRAPGHGLGYGDMAVRWLSSKSSKGQVSHGCDDLLVLERSSKFHSNFPRTCGHGKGKIYWSHPRSAATILSDRNIFLLNECRLRVETPAVTHGCSCIIAHSPLLVPSDTKNMFGSCPTTCT